MKKTRARFDVFYKTIRTDSYIRWSFLGAVILSLAGVLVYVYYQDRLPSVVPFYYSLPWGEERLARKEYLLILLASTYGAVLINCGIGVWIFGKEVVLSRIIALGTALYALLACSTVIRIIALIV